MPRRSWKRSVSTPGQNITHEKKSALDPVQRIQRKLLSRRFFNAPPEQVARNLLGKILVHRLDGLLLAGRIVETEAYLGQDDPAAHAASGRTARNFVLYGPPGHAYVYNIYGMHQCMNVSCLPDGIPGCVLLRALEPLEGISRMRQYRGFGEDTAAQKLTSGPGKLCQALGITRAIDNGRDLTSAKSPLGIYDDGYRCGEISVTPRIGIRKAADLPLRFFLARNSCVSARGR
jgi:DNA-3-methyladenine glycosylase